MTSKRKEEDSPAQSSSEMGNRDGLSGVNTLRTLLRNSGFSSLADLFSRLANMLLFVAVSRHLGVSTAGIYTLALSYFFVGSRFAFWGLDQLLTRDVARQPNVAERYFVNFVLLRLMLSVAITALLMIFVWQLPYEPVTKTTILLFVISIIPENITNICHAVYMAFEQMEYLSVSALLAGALKASAVLLVLGTEGDIAGVALTITLVSLLVMILNLFIVHQWFLRPSWRIDRHFCQRQLRVAFPFIFIGVFFILDNRLDIIVLSFIADEQAIGLYAAAAAVVTALAMFPQGVRTAILPILTRYQKRSPDSAKRLYQQIFKYMLLIVLPMAVGVMLTADSIIQLIYTEEFAPSATVLSVLVWSFVFYSLNIINSRMLIVHNRQAFIARFLLASLIINVILNVILVPQIGIVGASAAKVGSAAILFGLSQYAVRGLLGNLSLSDKLLRPIVGVLLMTAAVLLVAQFGLWVQIAVGILIYCGALWVTGAFTREERQLWRRALSTRGQ